MVEIDTTFQAVFARHPEIIKGMLDANLPKWKKKISPSSRWYYNLVMAILPYDSEKVTLEHRLSLAKTFLIAEDGPARIETRLFDNPPEAVEWLTKWHEERKAYFLSLKA